MIDKSKRRAVPAITVSTAALLALAVATPVYAASPTDTSALRDAVTAENIVTHMEAFQAVADANGGNRAAGTGGHVESAEYIEAQLDAAGYETTRQPFSYTRVVVDTVRLLRRVLPHGLHGPGRCHRRSHRGRREPRRGSGIDQWL